MTILQNIIFPEHADPDVFPLYADAETWTQIGGEPVRLSASSAFTEVLSRKSVRVPAGQRLSLASYFNAFPASYWQRWTSVKTVQLHLETEGSGTIVVYRSNAEGQSQWVCSEQVTGKCASEFHLPLKSFGDGGWYWFDLLAAGEELVLHTGSWRTDQQPVTEGKLSLGITTYNKRDFCLATLRKLADNHGLLQELDQILLVDQGSEKVSETSEFSALRKQLGEQLRLIEQANLGGSGGFSRAMAETLKLDATDFLMILDDDIELEPESVLRALQFARYNRRPMIVGGHMFDLLDKPVLHAWAETVRDPNFLWGPSFPEQTRHDFRERNLRQTPWMHARLDADYNGWWMCLIPKTIIQNIGLSLPVFIKWDDAEYGLRAREHGFRTVSLPGVALWHISWLDKDDTIDWQNYFHTRNRLIAALLHSDSVSVVQNTFRQDIKKLFNMQYYATELAIDAVEDVLKGPEHLHASIATKMQQARAKAGAFCETRVYTPEDADWPSSQRGRALPKCVNPRAQHFNWGPFAIHLRLFSVKTLLRQLTFGKHAPENAPAEAEYAKQDARWWIIPQHRSVLIGTADGSGKSIYRFDRAQMLSMLRKSYRLSRKLKREWKSLSKQYRQALPKITSPEEWEKTFRSEKRSQ